MKSVANFLFEVGMLQRTPRTGYQFLGSGRESVSEHVLRTVFIGYTLAKLEPDVDELQVLRLCLFHDLPEARTGDMNYVNKKYVRVDEEKAVNDLADTLSFGNEIASSLAEFNGQQTREALIARDADQIALILQLKECGDLGNKYSRQWIAYALKRLHTETGRKLADTIVETDSSDWWFEGKDDWWINAKE